MDAATMERVYRERDVMQHRLAQARRLLVAVAGSDRSSRGRLELTRELEQAVLAFTAGSLATGPCQGHEGHHEATIRKEAPETARG